MTTMSRVRGVVLAGWLILGLVLCGCAPSGLNGASTCKEFMNSSQKEQYDVVSKLASEYKKPSYATPLGRPNIPYYCAASPNLTLDRLFAGL